MANMRDVIGGDRYSGPRHDANRKGRRAFREDNIAVWEGKYGKGSIGTEYGINFLLPVTLGKQS
jgi:hypothetical protein